MAKKQMKKTGGDLYCVTLYGDLVESSNKKTKARVVEINEDAIIFTQNQPRSSKRITRMVPRGEFLSFSYNEQTEEMHFILMPKRIEIMSVVGEVEIANGAVVVEDNEGTVYVFNPADVTIEAMAGDKVKKSKKHRDEDDEEEEPRKKSKKRKDEDDEDEPDDDSDDDDSDDDSEDDEDEAPRKSKKSRKDEDDDEDDESDDDSDDDEDDDSDEDDSDDDEDDDDDDEDEAPRKGKGRRR